MTPTQRKAAIDLDLLERLSNCKASEPEQLYYMQKELRMALAEPAPEHRQTGWVAPKNHYAVPVLFNPYTGEPRDVRDVQSDPQGILIVPPGKVEMLAAPVREPESGAVK